MAALLLLGSAQAQSDDEITADDLRGPDVTIIQGETQQFQEYRQGDVLRAIKVIPNVGPAYYLRAYDPTGRVSDMEQADSWVPRWILFEF